MAGGFTIRYRSSLVEGALALIVEDEQGTAYLFREGTLQLRICGEHACEKLAGLLGGSARWDAVPRVAPYTPAGLRALTGREGDYPGPTTARATPVRPASLGQPQARPEVGSTRYAK